jgi:cation diffusion facilitator CzcD-associated flavoprotein CzcO
MRVDRWYYNRYPGLMCDVESYCYLPLLEETGYIPKHKYSYGKEIREYIESVTERYGIAKTAMFQTKIDSLIWDEKLCQWDVTMKKEHDGDQALEINVNAEFIIPTS